MFSPAIEESWWFAAPSRQSTGESTVCTASDLKLGGHTRELQMPKGDLMLHRRLAALPEIRGWMYFFRHVASTPILFVVGILLGAGIMQLVQINESSYYWPKPYVIEAAPKEVPAEYMKAAPLNNGCLLPNLEFPPGPQTFDACSFVIQSTDEIWNLRGDTEAAIDKYFHEGYLNAGSWGRRGVGKKAMKESIYGEMRAFPDIKIHITDCVCKGNDINGYKCAMPDVLTGTNTGPSTWGPATGRYARWTGMVESLVKKNPITGQWQYYAEWGTHDEWALLQQLGLDFYRIPHPPVNTEPLHDCSPLFAFFGNNGEPVINAQDQAEQVVMESMHNAGSLSAISSVADSSAVSPSLRATAQIGKMASSTR